MLKPIEKKQVAEALRSFFRTFQSSRSIEPEAAILFVEDASEFSLDAVLTAIRRFRSGQVPDRNDDFAPSVAAFIKEVRACQERVDVAEFWKKTDFLVVGSAEWKAICEARGVPSMPSIEYKGPRADLRGSIGWYCEKVEVARAAPLIAKHRKEMLRIERRGPLRLTND